MTTGYPSGNAGDEVYTASMVIPPATPVDVSGLFFSEYAEGSSNNKYLEIYNPNPNAIDLNNFYIANNSEADSRISLSEYSKIQGLGYLVVNLDSLVSQNSLNNGAGSIYLFFGNEIKDSLTFGSQASNYSIGRQVRDLTWSLNYPTPGAVNKVAPSGNISGIRINEWLANTDQLNQNEFIELVNPDQFPVKLSGASLSDSLNLNDNLMTIPDLSFIGPNSYAAIKPCLLYTSPSPRDRTRSRMPSSA